MTMLREPETMTIEKSRAPKNSRDVELLSEVWKPIPGFPRAEASSLGRIRHRRRDGRHTVLQPMLAPSAKYPVVSIWREDLGCYRPTRIHKLIAAAFHGPAPPGHHVRHLDDDASNARPDNLAHGTPRQNVEDQIRNGRHPAKLDPEKARAMRREYRAKRGERARLADKYGVSARSVCDVLAGRSYPEGGPAPGYPMRKERAKR